MTTVADARIAIHDRWIAQWGTRTTFAFEDEEFSEPNTAYAFLRVRNTGGGQDTLGQATNRKFEREGSIIVQIKTPILEGMNTGAGHAQFARGIFEATKFNGIACTDGLVRELGDDGKFYTHEVEVFFDYYETK